MAPRKWRFPRNNIVRKATAHRSSSFLGDPKRAVMPKRPRDPNRFAKIIVGIASGEVQDLEAGGDKYAAAVALKQKGGKARATRFSLF